MGCIESGEAEPQYGFCDLNKIGYKPNSLKNDRFYLNCSATYAGEVFSEEHFKKEFLPGSHFLNLNKFANRTPTRDELKELLKSMNIGTDSKVVCYDNEKNRYGACQAACLLQSAGLRSVLVVIKDINEYDSVK
jgi:3-mercaptopyruvate sulfurtransferase SseA